MKNSAPRVLITGILFMIVSIAMLLLRQPEARKNTDFSVMTVPTESSSMSESRTVTSTVGTVTSTTTVTNSTSQKTEITTQTTAVTETVTVTEFLKFDLNKATAEELCRLDGIGEVRAAAIIAYREEHGGFRSIDEMTEVDGIGPETFAAVREHIYVEAAAVTEPETTTVPAETTGTLPAETAEAEPVTEHVLTLEEAAPIDINTAGAEELMLLPHVDRKTAEKIIKFRGEINGFSNTYELLYIDELTQKQVAEILEFVTIGQ